MDLVEGSSVPTTGASVSAAAPSSVGALASASAGVVSIEENSDLLRARALMLRHDYSQLAVMSGPRRVEGAVSWKSMAMAALRNPEFTLRDAMVDARRVKANHDLVALIPTIVELGFVFVANPDKTLAGIVTTSDLSLEFGALAKPFLLIGQIEHCLRGLLTRTFTPQQLGGASDPGDSGRSPSSAGDLTLGEILRFISDDQHWQPLRWPFERAEFIKALMDVKDIRNEVMHFRLGALADQREVLLTKFARWLHVMELPAIPARS